MKMKITKVLVILAGVLLAVSVAVRVDGAARVQDWCTCISLDASKRAMREAALQADLDVAPGDGGQFAARFRLYPIGHAVRVVSFRDDRFQRTRSRKRDA